MMNIGIKIAFQERKAIMCNQSHHVDFIYPLSAPVVHGVGRIDHVFLL